MQPALGQTPGVRPSRALAASVRSHAVVSPPRAHHGMPSSRSPWRALPQKRRHFTLGTWSNEQPGWITSPPITCAYLSRRERVRSMVCLASASAAKSKHPRLTKTETPLGQKEGRATGVQPDRGRPTDAMPSPAPRTIGGEWSSRGLSTEKRFYIRCVALTQRH